jgi:hypothetical protein
MTKHLLGAIAIACALLAQPKEIQAQMPDLSFRVGAQTIEPTGDLNDTFDYGYGLYARVGTFAEPWALMGAITWNRFVPKSNALNDTDEFTIQAGPHFTLKEGFNLGAEVAYFTENEEFGLVPVLSIGLRNIEATLSYNTTFANPQVNWLALGIGFKF